MHILRLSFLLFVLPILAIAQKVELQTIMPKLENMHLEYYEPTENSFEFTYLDQSEFFEYDTKVRARSRQMEVLIALHPSGESPLTSLFPHIELNRLLANLSPNDDEKEVMVVTWSNEKLDERNADWGAEAYFNPRPDLTRHKYAKLISFFKDGYGMVVMLYCFSNPEQVPFLLAFTDVPEPDYSFGEDVSLIHENYEPIILESGQSRIVVLAEFQGRVMTSSSGGDEGRSYGWFHRKNIGSGIISEKNFNPGGEDRLWIGPEYGQYSVFFPQGAIMIGDNIRVPGPIDTEPFKLVSSKSKSAVFAKKINLVNYMGTEFNIDINRKIEILNRAELEDRLDVELADVKYVGFESTTTMKNLGNDWSKATGLLNIWSLGTFPPGKMNTVIIPTKSEDVEVTQYWSEVDHTRLFQRGQQVYYKGDGELMHKIGISPEHSLPHFGSYDPDRNLLTIIQYSLDKKGAYLNFEWEDDVDPYDGDAIMVFNDGPNHGRPPFGPFYELETTSPALELKSGESVMHSHATFHFEGTREQLSPIAEKLLGVKF